MTTCKNIDDAVISVHCHDDLGLAVANSLAAVKAGARQVEGTFNGIGERAGNCALEEVVMAMKTRSEYFTGVHTGIITREIVKTSRIISRMSGLHVPGARRSSAKMPSRTARGIHQDGILKKRETYEIMDPEEVGWGGTELPLTKHSGRHAMVARLEQLGFKMTSAEIANMFRRVQGRRRQEEVRLRRRPVRSWSRTRCRRGRRLISSNTFTSRAARPRFPRRRFGSGKATEMLQDSSPGNGAVDAAMQAIDRIVKRRGQLAQYTVEAVTQGRDSLGEVTLKVDFGNGELITGKGASTDVIEASARAYINAVNRAELLHDRKQASVLAPI